MADFQLIKQEIDDNVNTNGVGAITGAILNATLNDMVDAINQEKQDTIADLATIEAGAAAGATAYQKPSTGIPASDLASGVIPDISGKADKVTGATSGDLAGLDSNGNLTDSGVAAGSVALDVDVVHKSGTETITGEKTFESKTLFENDIKILDSNDEGVTFHKVADGVLEVYAAGGQGDVLLKGIATPSNNTDAANKGYVDGQVATKYTKPATGIPSSDMSTAVQTSLGLADTAIQDVSGKMDKVPSATVSNIAQFASGGGVVDSGVNVFDLAVLAEDASTPPASMEPNTVYKYGTLAGNTTFPALATPTNNDIANVYCWTFATPATAPTITWPVAITDWAGGSAPTINASKKYEVSVMDGLATIIEA